MRLLATGDWHVSVGADYGREPGSRLADQEAILARIAEIAHEEDVDAVLLAGDLLEQRNPKTGDLLAVRRALAALPPVPVIAITGNGRHDGNFPGQPIAMELFERIDHLHREPGIVQLGDVAVCTLPWVSESHLVASLDGGPDRDDLHQRAAELLIDTARGLRAQIDGPAILLCHWSISGAALPTGLPTDQLREVVLPLAELEAMGWDAVVAGHIHKPQLLSVKNTPGPGLYVGSPMPLNFGEAATDHGVWLLSYEMQSDMFVPRFLPIDSRPFRTIDVDLTAIETDDPTGVLIGHAGVNGDLDEAIVKVRFTATEEQARRIDAGRVKAALYEAGAHKVYAVEATVERAARARAEGLDESLGELEALGLYLDAQGLGEYAEAMRARTSSYLEAVR